MPKRKYKQRADGRYTASVTIGKLPNGNPKRKYVYASSPTELDKKISELKNNYYKGTISSNDSISFETWAKKWFQLNMSNKELATQMKNKNALENHIYKAIGYIKLKELKPIHIRELINSMMQKGLTDTTKLALNLIKRILNDAMVNDIIYKNVALNIKAPKFTKTENRSLSIYEDDILLTVAPNHKHGLFFLLLRYSGLRTEEIIPLLLDDFLFDKKKIRINKAVTLVKNQPILKDTKNKKIKYAFLPDFLIPIIQDEIDKKRNLNVKYLFTKQTAIDQMLTKTAVRRMEESFLYECNIEHENRQKQGNPNFVLDEENKIKFTPHQLRHSFCTMLYYAGVGIKEAQELMGHSSAKMVYDIYTHLDNLRGDSDEKINNYINNIVVKK